MKRLAVITAFCVALALSACATQSYSPPPLNGEQTEIVMEYGAGGDALSAMLGPGQDTLGDQIKTKFGSRVRIAGYWDWADYSVLDTIKSFPSSKSVIVIGDSCGASVGPFLAAAVNRPILAVIGIQASTYCPTVGATDPVPSNVRYALETYNPNCAETFGLGCRVYTAGASTNLKIVQRPDLHPALTQDSFNDVLDELSMIFASSATFKVKHGGTQRLVRYHNQRIR